MIRIFAFALAGFSCLSHAQPQGVSAQPLVVFDDAAMPAKEFRVLRTTYAPSAENPKHYHTSHLVFYVLEGTGIWQEEGKPAVTLKAGESLHVRPGTVHALFAEVSDLKVARMSSSVLQADRWVLNFHYLVGNPNGVEHFTEQHYLGLFTNQDYVDAFTDGVRNHG